MPITCCPACGHSLSRASRKPATVTLPERQTLDAQYAARELSKDAYFAACKAIGLRDDLRFFIRVTADRLQGNLAIEAGELLAQLETRAGKPADAKAINSLRDRYRMTLESLTVVRVSWLDSTDAPAELAEVA